MKRVGQMTPHDWNEAAANHWASIQPPDPVEECLCWKRGELCPLHDEWPNDWDAA